MAVIDTHGFYAGNIPVRITIESNPAEFILIYKVSISQIGSNTEVILDKIREELEKAKLETSEAQRQLDTEKSEKQINATRYDETIKAIKQRLTDVIQPQLSKLSADAFKPILDALQNVGVRPITGGYRSEVLNVRRIY